MVVTGSGRIIQDKIYQNGVAVADIKGEVSIANDTITFEQLSETSGLDKKLLFN